MNSNVLLEFGYIQYKSDREAANLFCKRIVDVDKTKYFIYIYEYDWSEYGGFVGPIKFFQAEARMYRGVINFDIVIRVRGETLEQIEQLVEDTWKLLGCDYDRYNNKKLDTHG